VVVSVPYCITFASRSKKEHDVTEPWITNEFVFFGFYLAALCNSGFTICGSCIQRVWSPL